ncbi:ABC transporter ATP-binding protein [Sulfurospirillum oryzae]|uniref:ABC transporter ATP-binding protein n=1 Tax=Sulfurospirillum oryzae TaxID=2976535 RepID=UPI0021E964C1|nr:ABC transporter ATP-binding protein [Sulfurospirillum oryzae]
MIISNTYAIEVRNVSKMYKKYKNSTSKILDLLGFSFRKNYEEFWPLKDINLTIKKGEKVGMIGRNGAGKTTLLSMISDNVKPTNGKIKVDGKISALFVLGTGFHPEFSGRENIRSSLAFQGITGAKALELEKEIIEFSELEDFIEQPLKTYSAGMYTRLAFTVSTAIKPEVLIIDEILGAGDAYFNSKALERMNNLTNSGATILFVSHDLSSVQKICDRCIWIDKGKIREDGSTLDVIKSYSADVRKREELRLLSQNSGVKINNQNSNTKQLLFRFITSQNSATEEKGFCVHKIRLFVKNKLLSEISIGDSMDNSVEQDGYVITGKKINWSDSFKKEGKWCREFKNFGGEYIHAIGIFQLPLVIDLKDVSFDIEYFDEFDDEIYFEFYDSKKNIYKNIKTITSSQSKIWQVTNHIQIFKNLAKKEEKNLVEEEIIQDIEEKNTTDIYGTGELIITKFTFLDESLEERFVFTVDEPIIFRVNYKYFEDIYNPVFVVAIYKPDGTTITQLIDKQRGYKINKVTNNSFVDFKINNLKIGKGEYLVSVAIFHDIDLTNPIEQKTYCLHDRKYKFKIEQPYGLNMDLGLIYQDFEVKYGSEHE